MITDILEVVGHILILLGSAVCLAGAIGVVRFRDTLARMHPATMPQVVGVLLVLSGAILNLRGSVDIWMLVLASMFIVSPNSYGFGAPPASMPVAISRVSWRPRLLLPSEPSRSRRAR